MGCSTVFPELQMVGRCRCHFRRSSTQQIRSRILDARARARDDLAGAWGLVEDAHVLSQPWAVPTFGCISPCCKLGWASRDPRETLGQLTRIVMAAAGSWLRRYPTGNTGRARVPAILPM